MNVLEIERLCKSGEVVKIQSKHAMEFMRECERHKVMTKFNFSTYKGATAITAAGGEPVKEQD